MLPPVDLEMFTEFQGVVRPLDIQVYRALLLGSASTRRIRDVLLRHGVSTGIGRVQGALERLYRLGFIEVDPWESDDRLPITWSILK
jgi:hypothetical protein